MDAVSIAWLCGFKSAENKLEFRFEKAHDQATIVILILHWVPSDDCGDDSVMKYPRSRLDRSSIGPRSWSSSANRHDRPMEIAT